MGSLQSIAALRPKVSARLHFLAAIVLLLLVFSAYSNSFHAGFAMDSRSRVLTDPRISAINRTNVSLIFSEDYWWPRGYSRLYRPVTTLSYLLNRAILFNPEDAAGYRLLNLLLHAVNAFLLYLVALFLVNDWWTAMLIGSLWAVHPVCTESVTNIVGRADELSATAILGALLLTIGVRHSGGMRRRLWQTALMLVTLGGLLAKEIAAIIPGVVLLYDFARRPAAGWSATERRGVLTGYLVFVPPFLIAWYLRAASLAHSGPVEMPFVDNPIQGSSFLTGRLTAIKVIGKYMWLLVWPLRQSCDYSYNQVPLIDWHFKRFEDWKAVAALFCLVLLMAVAIAAFRRQKAVFFFMGLSVLALLPVTNLIFPIGTIMAERFLYLPAAGFAGCVVALAFASVGQYRKMAIGAVVVLIGLAAVRTYTRNLDWADDETLWTQAVQASPDSFKTHMGLAEIRAYNHPLDTVLDEAIQETEKALSIVAGLPPDKSPNNVYALLGEFYRLKGEAAAPRKPDGTAVPSAQSRLWYEKALSVLSRGVVVDRAVAAAMHRQQLAQGKRPDQIAPFGLDRLYASLGLTRLRLQMPRQALDAFVYQRRLDPGNPAVYRYISRAHLESGNLEGAVIALIGAHLLSDSDLDQAEIRDLYQRRGVSECALTRGYIPTLNVECPTVRNDICASLAEIARALHERMLEPGVTQMKDIARNKYACPMDEFERSLQ